MRMSHRFKQTASRFAGSIWWKALTGCCCLALIGLAVFFATDLRDRDDEDTEYEVRDEPTALAAPTETEPAAAPAETPKPRRVRKARDVYAAWYDVPPDSLAKRRAGLHELTAAHNKLPIGTRVRVTRLENGKTVEVRITDRGIRDRKVRIDLCREAAEQLEMLHKGVARVRMEILPDEHGAAPPESHTAAPQQ